MEVVKRNKIIVWSFLLYVLQYISKKTQTTNSKKSYKKGELILPSERYISISVHLYESECFQRAITFWHERNSIWPGLWLIFTPVMSIMLTVVLDLSYHLLILLSSAPLPPIGRAKVSHLLDNGCLSEHHWRNVMHVCLHICGVRVWLLLLLSPVKHNLTFPSY